jgi:hypothetical protein
MPCDDGTVNNPDGSCTCPVHPSPEPDDFTQSSWYRGLYSDPNSALLGNNDPPLDKQLPSLRVHQLEAIAELQAVNQRIQSLQSLLSAANSRRDSLQKVVDGYRTVLSPIRRAPFEIIHRIAEINGLEGWGRATEVAPGRKHVRLCNGPWTFSKVCQYWRAVAIQSTEFWSNIRICFSPRADRASLGLSKLLDEGVRRSAERQLRVVLRCGVDNFEDDSEDSRSEAVNVFRALFSHSEQIRVLDLTAIFSYELDFIYSSFYHFGSLERLSICILEMDDLDLGGPDHGAELLDAFEESWSLREVKLDGVLIQKHWDDLYFPWEKLQSFEHRASLSIDDALTVLITCPELQKYIVSHPVTHGLTITPFEPILHTALTYLELSAYSLSILQYTKIPSLTVLHVKHVDNSQLIHLTQFISRSQCSIQVLDLSLTGIDLEDDSFLDLLPSVTRLRLGLNDITQLRRFRLALTPERLPRLEALEIRMLTHSDPLTLYTPQLMSTLIHIIRSRSARLQLFAFYLRAFGERESTREGIKSLRVLLAPYSQELRTRIEAGTKLCLLLGAFCSFRLHVIVLN